MAKWLDLTLSTVFPRLTMRAMQARIAIKNYYDGAVSDRFRTLRGQSNSPDENARPALAALREQARNLDDNYDVASCALDTLVNNVIGTGIMPDPIIKNKDGSPATELNDELRRLHKEWARRPEVTRELDYSSMQRLVCRSWVRDGESFMQYLEGNVRGLAHQSRVPLSLEPLESDFVPENLDDPAKKITQGITKNDWGQPTTYHVYKQHPGERTAATGIISTQDTKPVSKDRMMHLKLCKRIRQTRGITRFACVLTRFDDIKEIEESERVASRVAAAMAGAIKKGSPDLYMGLTAEEQAQGYRNLEFAPGMIFDDLRVGESVETIGSNRPNNGVIEFVDANMRRAAGGIGINYSSLAKDFNGSYSAQRQELSEAYVNYGVMWHAYKETEARPTWERFVKMAISSGVVAPAPEVDLDTLFEADYSRPVMPWVDPAKEMAGIETELALNLNSKSGVMRSRGRNPDEIRKKIAEDQEQEATLGIENKPPVMQEPDDTPPPDEDEDGDIVKTEEGYYRKTAAGYERVKISTYQESSKAA